MCQLPSHSGTCLHCHLTRTHVSSRKTYKGGASSAAQQGELCPSSARLGLQSFRPSGDRGGSQHSSVRSKLRVPPGSAAMQRGVKEALSSLTKQFFKKLVPSFYHKRSSSKQSLQIQLPPNSLCKRGNAQLATISKDWK